MAETGEESHFLSRKTKQASRKKTKQVSIPVKGQASIPENQTIVAYTDDELASIRDNMVLKNTKKKYKYTRTPFAVLVQG